MGLFDTLKDGMRRALDVKRERTLPSAGPVPRVGSYIAKGDVRIWVNEEMSYELWRWLAQREWREIHLATDRRRYRAAKPSAIDELAFADTRHREDIERQLIATAEMTEFERNRKVEPRRS